MSNPPADERPARVAPAVAVADIVLPSQTNNHGTMFGGDVMAMMDKAAAIAALRFCRLPVVTASTERIDFRTPIRQGEIVEARARVVWVGRTSMIVRIHVYAEHPIQGDVRLCTTGYFSMVAVNSAGEKVVVPQLLLENDETRAEWQIGSEVHQALQARRAAQQKIQ